ncbi:MAG: hypothetical protein JWM08_306, partial [Candidatus Angelobacter sp.]|nr:hypothetical protein [Candidatus Angelobacter sp.]
MSSRSVKGTPFCFESHTPFSDGRRLRGPSVTHLVAAKVIEGFVSTLRMWTGVAVMWIEAVIHVTIEIVR